MIARWMKSIGERVLPLPIAVFLALFFTVVVFLFIGIGWYMLERMAEVKQVVAESNMQAADREIETAIDRVFLAVDESSEAVGGWEEAYQQLYDPTYYNYWRDNRALQAGNLPNFIHALELYDANGQILNQHPKGVIMPLQVPDKSQYLQSDHGIAMLYDFRPILDRSNNDAVLGYSGLRVDFLAALLAINKFNHADTTTLSMLIFDDERITPQQVQNALSYSPHGLVETAALEQVMRESLIHFSLLALFMTLFGYLLVSKLLHAPLRCLTRYIDDLRSQNEVVLREPRKGPLCLLELELLRDSLEEYQEKLFDMHNRLDQKNTELWEMAHRDPLTGIANRRAYDEEWHQLNNLVRGQRLSVAVLLIDCDHFKAINDTYGHIIGDDVLRNVANALRAAVREGDRLYRLGGDEFAIHMLNGEAENAQKLAVRCMECLAEFDFNTLGIREPVRFSIGIAVASGTDTDQLNSLHHNADIAMYRAKRPGHGKIVLFQPNEEDLDASVLLSNRYINAVYGALEQPDLIELEYQPVVALQANCEGHFEILARLRDRDGIIMPATLLPVVVAEQLETEFDYAVLTRIEQAFALGEIPKGTHVAINLGAATLLHPQLCNHLERLKQRLEQHTITLEITENALISDLSQAAKQIHLMRECGFIIALDDFGSGYSSLRYLSTMPVDIVKFDIAMVHDLEREDGQRQITETTARMIHEAGYQMVAEGVESELLLERVRKCGFTHAQGYLLGRPEPSIDSENSLQRLAKSA